MLTRTLTLVLEQAPMGHPGGGCVSGENSKAKVSDTLIVAFREISDLVLKLHSRT